jgi:penicillin-binding protein 1A
MATVFATFAADGVRHDPTFIKRVEDASGKVIFQADQAGVRAIDSQVARTVTDVLQGVITEGTGTRARLNDQVAAGKTGTTDNKSDAWFVGYTPNLVAAVWMGIPSAQIPMGRVGQFGSVYGGTYPALIWHNFMSYALAGKAETPFIPPDEKLWPYGRYVSEAGRGKTVYNNDRSTSRTTKPPPFFGFPPPPSSVPPASPPPSTSPPATTPSTAPPPGP